MCQILTRAGGFVDVGSDTREGGIQFRLETHVRKPKTCSEMADKQYQGFGNGSRLQQSGKKMGESRQCRKPKAMEIQRRQKMVTEIGIQDERPTELKQKTKRNGPVGSQKEVDIYIKQEKNK